MLNGMDSDTLNHQLYDAAKNGLHEAIKRLIEEKADVNCFTTLIIAAQKNYPKCIETLIDAKTDINIKDWSGDSPINCAARHENPECLKLLIAANGKVNTVMNSGFTPLMCAASHNSFECVQELIAAGADLTYIIKAIPGDEFRNQYAGITVLNHAAKDSNLPICTLLIEAMLSLSDSEQKKSLYGFLYICKFFAKESECREVYRNRVNLFKKVFRDALYEYNKKNFSKSRAYEEIMKIPNKDPQSEAMQKALLEKFNPLNHPA